MLGAPTHIPRPAGVSLNDVAIEPSDEELIHRTLAGEHDAFAALVRRHRRAALARALGVLGDPADADDIAQEAFVHAFERLATPLTTANMAAAAPMPTASVSTTDAANVGFLRSARTANVKSFISVSIGSGMGRRRSGVRSDYA